MRYLLLPKPSLMPGVPGLGQLTLIYKTPPDTNQIFSNDILPVLPFSSENQCTKVFLIVIKSQLLTFILIVCSESLCVCYRVQ